MNKKLEWIDIDDITFNLDQVQNLMDLLSDEIEEFEEAKNAYKSNSTHENMQLMAMQEMQRIPYMTTLNGIAKDILNDKNKLLKSYVNQQIDK